MAIKKKLKLKVVRIGIYFSLAALSTIQLAAQAQVPNVFASGTPAKAAEVNENFTALNNKIESISAPEKGFSVLSSETLDSGLVRTKLYAYEAGSTYTAQLSTETGNYVNVGSEYVLNALGKFRGEYKYSSNGDYAGQEVEREIDSATQVLEGACPNGDGMDRSVGVLYTYTLINDRGAFVMSDQGASRPSKGMSITANDSKAGSYFGCDEGFEYYYLEGLGTGIYSCIDRVAYYGAFTDNTGVWDKAYAPSSRIFPLTLVGVFDGTTNGVWGTYYLEIDAPEGCLDL
jgi:hypothetical protein